jgi:two-component sensor histidine kinase
MAFPQPLDADIALSLALAVIEASNVPLLLLDGDLSVIAASASFRRAFEIDPSTVSGRKITELGAGEWALPQLRSLLEATAARHADIEAYAMDLQRDGHETRNLILNARRLAYLDDETVRLVLTVSDVTEARAAERLRDDMIREKALLLLELQHRVANSLQIIASVLLQSARRVQSDETRSHLHAAHQRVMSVAALQKQLAISAKDEVGLRSYFTELCKCLGASMIRDSNETSLEVEVDDGVMPSDVSVSLGLIVTELVINALKHAFPNDRRGRIRVSFQSNGTAWTLRVRDDGVGMSPVGNGQGGLGTSLINALAKQLQARVDIADGNPGAVVSIIHGPASLPGHDAQSHGSI